MFITINLFDAAWKLVKSTLVKKGQFYRMKKMKFLQETAIVLTCRVKFQKIWDSETGPKNVDEKSAQQLINNNSTLQCYKELSDDACRFWFKRKGNFVKYSESDEEKFATHQKVSHVYSLVNTKVWLNHLELDKSIHVEKNDVEKIWVVKLIEE